jgi:hypothetical protein
MKRCILAIVVVLALCAIPATAQKTVISLGACAGITGTFNGSGTFLPIDMSMRIFFYKWVIMRAEIGPVIALGSSDAYLDFSFGMEFPIIADSYALVEVGTWVPPEGTDASIIFAKAEVGYRYKGFFAELGVPFMYKDETTGLFLGWEIRAGYRFTLAGGT